MECMQLRSPPGPFHYLISEQAKSFVALQELQNEVGALLEFRDLVIETFPNLRSKMGPASAAAGRGAGRGEWEPGVRVRRKLPATGDAARAKPQPSVQDSGFSTETSCGKDNAPPAAAPPAPLEDELWQLLDVIQRKGGRLRDEVELLRGDLRSRSPSPAPSPPPFAPDSARAEDARRLRAERDALLEGNARLDAVAAAELAELRATKRELEEQLRARSSTSPPAHAVLGKLDAVLETPVRTPRVSSPDPKKFAAILQERNPVELQRHLLHSTVHTQVLFEKLNRVSNHRAVLLDRLERAKEENDDLKFRLEEKSIELEGTKARMRMLERGACSDVEGESRSHGSMRAMRPLTLPEPRIHETPRRVRPSRIPLPPSLVSQGGSRVAPPAPRTRPHDSLSRLSRDSPAASVSATRTPPQPAAKKLSSVPVRRANSAAAQRGGAGGKDDAKVRTKSIWNFFF